MSRVKAVRKVEDCLDGSVVKEISMAEALDETVMQRMATLGTLNYFPHFPRPYFRIQRRRCYVLQGVLGNQTFRVTFLPAADATTERELLSLAEGTPAQQQSLTDD